MKKSCTLLFLLASMALYANGKKDPFFIPAKWYVNNNSLTGDIFTTAIGNNANNGSASAPFASLEFAMNAAQAGDSIFVDAGTYVTADFTITKAINFVGTNYKISPNNPADKLQLNPGLNAESIISGATLTLGANNISLLGLTFDAGNKMAVSLDNTTSSNNNYGNFSFIKNRLKINGGTNQVALVGVGASSTSPAALINSTFNITDNRFEKYNGTQNATLSIHLIKTVTISDNSFVVAGAAFQSQTAILFGNAGVVDALIISNNIVERAANFINGNRVGTALISGNTINNCNNAMVVNCQHFESTNFQFSNNILNGNLGFPCLIFYLRGNGGATNGTNIFKAENNIFNITAVPGVTTQLGFINATFISTVLSPTLVIRGNKMNITGNLSSVEGQYIRPIVIKGKLADATVENNEIAIAGTNMQPANPTVTLPLCAAISIYSDNGAQSFIPAGAVINILNNKVAGFKQSFVIYDPTNAANGGNDYTGYGNLAPDIAVNVHNNSFTGDSVSINNGVSSNNIEATCNWYGVTAVQDLINKLSIQTGNFVPWLTNGTDNNAAVGFQPLPNVCNGTPMMATIDGFTNVDCHGAATGSIQITISGGLPPYTYAWIKDGNPGFSSTVQDPTNLTAGTYHVTVTDALGTNLVINSVGDLFTVDVTITEPPTLTASANGTNVICISSTNGTATATASGGTTPYSYSWSNGATTQSINNLLAGNYTATVTDAHGCTANASYNVAPDPLAPSPPAITAGTTTTFCIGGSVTLSSNAPNGNKWYKDGIFYNGSTGTTLIASLSGTYTARIAVGNCESIASNAIIVTVNSIPATPVISQVGNALQSTAASGNQWYLNGGIIVGATNQNYTPTLSGNYTVKVTVNNCTSSFSSTFNFIITGLPNIDVFDNLVKVFPNPVKDNLVITHTGPVALLNIRLLDINGKELKSISSGLSRIDVDMAKYSAGSYIIWIEDSKNKIRGKKIIVKF